MTFVAKLTTKDMVISLRGSPLDLFFSVAWSSSSPLRWISGSCHSGNLPPPLMDTSKYSRAGQGHQSQRFRRFERIASATYLPRSVYEVVSRVIVFRFCFPAFAVTHIVPPSLFLFLLPFPTGTGTRQRR